MMTPDPTRDGAPSRSRLDRGLRAATGAVAAAGGLLALAMALLVVVSVLGRWLFDAPIDGDFEFVKMATAIAVFTYLPHTQIQGGNIFVSTFTDGLPARMRAAMDAFWDLIYGAFAGFLTYALLNGTLDAIRSGETTMMRQLPIWPSIALSTALIAMLTVVAVLGALLRLSRRAGGHDS